MGAEAGAGPPPALGGPARKGWWSVRLIPDTLDDLPNDFWGCLVECLCNRALHQGLHSGFQGPARHVGLQGFFHRLADQTGDDFFKIASGHRGGVFGLGFWFPVWVSAFGLV